MGYKLDDIITIKIGAGKSAISFYKNKKLIREIKHIKMVKYRLAAFFYGQMMKFWNCIHYNLRF